MDRESALDFSEIAYRLAFALRLSGGKTINDREPIRSAAVTAVDGRLRSALAFRERGQRPSQR